MTDPTPDQIEQTQLKVHNASEGAPTECAKTNFIMRNLLGRYCCLYKL